MRVAMIPTFELTEAAATALLAATRELGDQGYVKVFVDDCWDHGLDVGPRGDGDVAIPTNGVTLLCHPELAERLDGVVIDYVVGPDGSGFHIENPNAPAAVRPLAVRELKTRLDAGETMILLDVRTPQEIETARIDGSRRHDLDDIAELTALDPTTTLVFSCHHGIRSPAAARYWSVDIDPSVPRY